MGRGGIEPPTQGLSPLALPCELHYPLAFPLMGSSEEPSLATGQREQNCYYLIGKLDNPRKALLWWNYRFTYNSTFFAVITGFEPVIFGLTIRHLHPADPNQFHIFFRVVILYCGKLRFELIMIRAVLIFVKIVPIPRNFFRADGTEFESAIFPVTGERHTPICWPSVK